MQEKTDKLITWVLLGIAVLGGIFAIIFAWKDASAMFDVAYWITFLFVIIALLGMIGFFCVRFIKNFSENPKKARMSLIVFGIAVVVAVLAFILSSGTDVSNELLLKNGLTESTSKWIGTACIVVYILFFGAVASIIYSECSKMFKK